jgi:hypothetical protein
MPFPDHNRPGDAASADLINARDETEALRPRLMLKIETDRPDRAGSLKLKVAHGVILSRHFKIK